MTRSTQRDDIPVGGDGSFDTFIDEVDLDGDGNFETKETKIVSGTICFFSFENFNGRVRKTTTNNQIKDPYTGLVTSTVETLVVTVFDKAGKIRNRMTQTTVDGVAQPVVTEQSPNPC